MYGCLGFILFGVFFLVVALGLNLLRLLFGVRRAARRFTEGMAGTSRKAEPSGGGTAGKPAESGHAASHRSSSGKFFDKSEGEYVDFEEL